MHLLQLRYTDIPVEDTHSQPTPDSINDNRRSEIDQLDKLGSAYLSQNLVERAIDCYEKALAIAREIGDRHSEGKKFGNLGNAYADMGQIERARELYLQALTIFKSILPADHPYIQNIRGNLSRLSLWPI